MRGESHANERRPVISHLIAGLSVFLVLWLLAGGAAYLGLAGSVLRLLAFLSTWIAATIGLGATIITRAGTRTVSSSAARRGAAGRRVRLADADARVGSRCGAQTDTGAAAERTMKTLLYRAGLAVRDR